MPENESIQMSENTVYNKTSEPSDLLYSTVEDSPFPIYAEIRVKKPGILSLQFLVFLARK